ncbi:type VII secretion protein EccCa [Streptomyces sp. BH055]|uniref:type VII secretion protein EccCa n=1 Tax=Streptomyces sp. BH055 TaxID=3401173 RepID=UPI003BB602A0
MTQQLVHRPARSTRPLPEPAGRAIEAPPNLPEGKTGNAATALLPMAGVMSSVVMMTVIRNSQFAALGAIVLVVALFGAIALFLSQRGKAQRTRRVQRERYLEYLEELREEFSGAERARRHAARALNPPPEALYDLIRDPARLWERRRGDADFLRVRAGSGDVTVQDLTIAENSAGGVLTPPDPFMLNEARALAHRFTTAADFPLTVPLDRAGNVSIIGEREDVLRAARALLTQVAVTHAPDDAALALASADEAAWQWAKWLPHILDPQTYDGPVPARRIAPNLSELARQCAVDLGRRAGYAAEVRRGLAGRDALRLTGRLLMVSDTHGQIAAELPRPDAAIPPADMGVTVLHLLQEQVHEPDHVSVRITVDGDHIVVDDLRTPPSQGTLNQGALDQGTLDPASAAGAEGIARMLAPLRLSAESAVEGTPVSGPVDFPALLGIDDPAALDLTRLWAPRTDRDFLRVPIALTDRHEPVLLDLKESSQLGMGPHGLCVGATGSGKSELLRTLVLALATTHSPEDLALVLVDYKGGATFAPFTKLPHVAGMITNLENQAGLVERVHTSLAGEVKRRQQVLKDAGNIADIGSYAHLGATTRPDLEPLPHLCVVIDEFGELITAKPEFIDLFLSIGRIGRSIGVHLLLSSQRIESGKLKGLDTYLSYRLGLRTFSADESRTVLDTTDAFHLPPLPGFGYLKVDTSTYERFKAGYVSGAYTGPSLNKEADATPLAWPDPAYPQPQTATTDTGPEPTATQRDSGPSVLAVMIDQLAAAAPPVRRIWLPPLPEATSLDAAAGPLDAGRDGMRLPHDGRPLHVPLGLLGLLDDPARQLQQPWLLDLTVAGGHTAVIGGPASGKTTLLRTLTLSLALTHTPREVAVYGLDLVGGGLSALDGLPHVGGIASRNDHERVARTLAELRAMLAEREVIFRELGIDSMDQLRHLRATGKLPQLAATDIILVIDGFGALRDEFADLDDQVADLLKRGSSYGIHIVAAMLRWNDVRIATQSMFGTRLELRLNDPTDSTVDRALSETLTADNPGRVLTDGKLFAQVALPRIDHQSATGDLATVLERTARTIRASWHGEGAPPVRVLPTRLPAPRLPSSADEPARIPLGVDQDILAPVLLDLFGGGDQHLLILGDNECGKTNLLKLIVTGLTERYTDKELVFGVFDPRRGLRPVVPEPYRGGYAHNTDTAARLATGIEGVLAKRLPETADPDNFDDEPTFTGPHIVILVDDYDILTAAGQQPLAPFLPYISSAQDIGLHFVLARRTAGASRALYEPVLTALRETGSTALVMDGQRGEGQLFPGLYATQQPPGRGTLVRRGRPHQLIHTALHDTTTAVEEAERP